MAPDSRNPRTAEYRGLSLSFGVLLFDSVTGNLLEQPVDIGIEELDVEPARTPSGYYAFSNLDNFSLDTVRLRVDAGEEYFTEERTVVLVPQRADYDPDDPETVVVDDPTEGVRIDLTPTPAYRFAHTTTHVRGHVRDADGNPVTGASVSLPDFDVSSRTVAEGEYVMPVPVESKHVFKTNGEKTVKLNGKSNGNGNGTGPGTNGSPLGGNDHLDDPRIEVSHPEYGTHTEPVEIEPGARSVHYVTLE